ncbi:ATP-binding protein [Lentzea sp. DG1S-22]|uniref:ATP-binding protein n=1 Tax=Lentzea sp. DG1S-22 TaxID=3108822 RepID=UPI002E75DF73|nr:ATP-binding protein [Lentzea sp. DG1S-22]WVH83238.1 ATP-binding protein [Lentzea sp. DG1S-22]
MADANSAGGWHVMELASTAPDTAKIRRWAQSILSNVREDDVLDVLLVITELASNIFDHARLPARLKLHRSDEPCTVSIVAEDASPVPPQLQPSRPDSVRGRGLVIVNRLAKQWGVAQRNAGKAVWAVIPCAAAT